MTTAVINNRQVHYFESRYFKVDGKQYEITATKSTGPEVHQCIHTVKGATESKEMKHTSLIALFKAGRLKPRMP